MPLIKFNLLGSHKHYCPQMCKLHTKKATFLSSSSPLNLLADLIIVASKHIGSLLSFTTLTPQLIY